MSHLTIPLDQNDHFQWSQDAGCMEVRCFSFGPFILIPSRQALLRRGIPVRLGTRALEILIALVQRPGAIIEKQELMSLVWNGTFVDESNLKVHIAALRKALDDNCSQSSCIATIIGRGYRFVQPVHDCALCHLTEEIEQLKSSPKCTERLFGRDDIVQQLAMQVEENRLVTLVGSAGVGKTAVAIAVSETLKRKFDRGTCFVDLNTLKDPDRIPAAVSAAVGLRYEAGRGSEQLVGHLHGAELLMILDTCERAIDAATALIELLHSSCPHVHILATSRETLRATGEQVFRLPALGAPPRTRSMTAEEMQRYPAVQLFLDRVAERPEDRRFTDGDVSLIASICEELDGIPLAIELAARRVRALGFVGLPPIFTDYFFSLNHGQRTGPQRHQNLGAALDWSLDLLPADELYVLRRLSSIEGWFDLDEAILRTSNHVLSKTEVSTCIANLVSKSLVERQGHSIVVFRLLNSVRYYVSRKFAPYSEKTMPHTQDEELENHTFQQLIDGRPAYFISAKDISSRAIPR